MKRAINATSNGLPMKMARLETPQVWENSSMFAELPFANHYSATQSVLGEQEVEMDVDSEPAPCHNEPNATPVDPTTPNMAIHQASEAPGANMSHITCPRLREIKESNLRFLHSVDVTCPWANQHPAKSSPIDIPAGPGRATAAHHSMERGGYLAPPNSFLEQFPNLCTIMYLQDPYERQSADLNDWFYPS